MQNQANNLYEQGVQLLKQGHASAKPCNSCGAPTRWCGTTAPTNWIMWPLSWPRGKFDDAESNLKTLLEGDPNNGPANLLSARLMVQQGHIPDAESHYHRAIYGAWPENAPAHRLAVAVGTGASCWHRAGNRKSCWPSYWRLRVRSPRQRRDPEAGCASLSSGWISRAGRQCLSGIDREAIPMTSTPTRDSAETNWRWEIIAPPWPLF